MKEKKEVKGKFYVQAIPVFSDNYIWVIVNETEKLALCVDPGEAALLKDFLLKNDLKLQAVLITHHHADHIGALPELLSEQPELAIYGPKDPRIAGLSHSLEDGDLIKFSQLSFKIWSIPGHTSTHLCFIEPKQAWLFCGDTLFSGGCGRVFDGSMSSLYQSLERLKSLPENTKVFCAHEYTLQNLYFAQQVEPDNQALRSYFEQVKEKKGLTLPSTIGLEKQINPFLRTELKTIQAYAQKTAIESLNPFSVFEQLRKEKDNFSAPK